ncbi:tetratricopeptide repeat protein [Pseudoduganella umbonata]|uniref:Tetratricopeptide repeat protein n=1 Tax=Pseudoduganella umbonata TaxID=864828 RepID=A0A4P8HNR2_9BURK|nr:tetratricopeptide repeat protein [Pseudoduganella umbonata]MBB3220082.1 Tfp pilus assembly protein PilF [Pseudoduganella umbonata]QCP10082.1 tetratricopeptide repeat protein [Pseudoduganella umbonata]
MPFRPPLILALVLLHGLARAAADCPAFNNTVSGGDYTNAEDRQKLDVVERFHFTPQVERLERGQSGYLVDDIGYTLDHFANHHRALTAMARLAVREKSSRPKGAKYSIECYFDRAIRFRPDDSRVRAIFGGYLLVLGQEEAALTQLQEAARLEPNNATNQYNLGLLHLRRKNFDKARQAAKRAYELGIPLPGLKNKLVAAGQWKD